MFVFAGEDDARVPATRFPSPSSCHANRPPLHARSPPPLPVASRRPSPHAPPPQPRHAAAALTCAAVATGNPAESCELAQGGGGQQWIRATVTK